jgi:sterol desaturase/sphingolipid hydroxylase (fatty acid hydroxylase superfamily)
MQTNFALHFRFWDRLLGTEFTDDATAARLYARDRQAAEVLEQKRVNKIKAS